ncbi:hypothetical protein [Paenibacillus agricola]|uniref:Uncharacterized protein n=1 Tax=Paenibacillus agricola TaxID=2716264 RepID=A0ABX0JB24_9BACL|nr:hypothetical protein [Paenibacillus agricola]NHN31151.1 hypothetical protein [Paenibacillus agricola]
MNEKRFNIEAIPVLTLFVATDKQMRLRLSADIVDLYELKEGGRVTLGYDSGAQAIAIKRAATANDPTAATIDKRGYVSARPFFHRTRVAAESRRYVFASEQDGWLVFVAE